MHDVLATLQRMVEGVVVEQVGLDQFETLRSAVQPGESVLFSSFLDVPCCSAYPIASIQ